jgi:hypothetical protein
MSTSCRHTWGPSTPTTAISGGSQRQGIRTWHFLRNFECGASWTAVALYLPPTEGGAFFWASRAAGRSPARGAGGGAGAFVESFACERGTCPQGGVESCYVFLAVMDWMLAVVKRSSDEPVVYRVSESETVEVSETVFADDASLYQRSLKSMQSVVDACMLFCGFTCICTATLGNVGGYGSCWH